MNMILISEIKDNIWENIWNLPESILGFGNKFNATLREIPNIHSKGLDKFSDLSLITYNITTRTNVHCINYKFINCINYTMNVNINLVNDIETIEASLEQQKSEYLSKIFNIKLRSRCVISAANPTDDLMYLYADMKIRISSDSSQIRKLHHEIYKKLISL